MTRYFPLYVFPTRILSDFWDDDALHLMQLRKDKKIGLMDEPTEWCSQNGCEPGHACCIAADGSLSSSFELGTGDVDKWRTQCTTPTPTKVGGCNAYVPGLPFEFPCADEWDATAPFSGNSRNGYGTNLKGKKIIKGCSRINNQGTNNWGAWCMTKYKYPEWGHPTWDYMPGVMTLSPSVKELDGNTSFANRFMMPCKPECPGYVAPGDFTGQLQIGVLGTLAPTGDKLNCPNGVCLCEASGVEVWHTLWGNYLHWWQHGTNLYVKTKKGDFVHVWQARDPSKITNASVYSAGYSDGNLKSIDVNKQVGFDGTRLDSYGYVSGQRHFAVSGKLNGHVFVSIDTTAWNAWHKKLGFKLGGGYPFPYKHRIDDACFTSGGWCRVKCDDPSVFMTVDGIPVPNPKGKYVWSTICVKNQWISADGKIGLRKGYYTPPGAKWKGSANHWYLFDPEDPEAIKIQITDSSIFQVTIREDFVENDGMCANKYPPAFHMPNQPSPGEPIPYEDWVLSEAEAKALCDFTKWGDPTKGECQPLKAPQPVTWEGGPDLPVVAQAEEPNKFCVVPTTTTTTTEDTGHVCKHYESEDSCPVRCSWDGAACAEPPCSSHASKGECCGDCEWQQGRCQPAMFKACPKEGKPGTNKCPKGCTFVDNCEQCEFAAGVWKKDFSKEPWSPRSGSRPQGCFRNRKFNIKCNKFEPGSKYPTGVNKVGTKRGKWPICKIIEPPKKC